MNNELNYLGDILFAVGKHLKKNTESALKEYGLGTGQLHILFMFYIQPDKPISQKKLVEGLKVDKGNVSRSISKLIEKGYIEKDVSDKNLYILTASGFALKDELIAFFKATHEKMTMGLSEDQLLITMNSLMKMNKNLEVVNES